MLLTACITTFNRYEYFKIALNSLFEQTNKEFQILVLDNGNDVKTINYAKNYLDIPNFEYRRHLPMSISKQRNLALNLTKTKYIGFLDDDDIWAPNKVEVFLDLLKRKKGSEIHFWYSGFSFFNSEIIEKKYDLYDSKSDLNSLLLQKGDFTASASNPILNIKNVYEVGGYNDSIVTGEDWELYLRLAEKYNFIHEPQNLVYIRQHDGPRLGDKLRNYINTEIIIYRRFFETSNEKIKHILSRKIASKLIRINKPKQARKILYISTQKFSSDQLINIVMFI